MDRQRVLGFGIIGTILAVLLTAGIIGQREDPAATPAPSGQLGLPVVPLPTSEVIALQRSPAPEVEPVSVVAARVDGDLLLLDPTRSSAMAMVRVTADVPAEYFSALGVLAESIDVGSATRIGGSAAPFERQLPAGAYRLRWTIGGAPGPEIAERIELAPGESRQVIATVPGLQSWVAHIEHLAGLGPQARMAIPRIDSVYALGGADDEGTVPFALPEAPTLEAKTEIYCPLLKMVVPAHIAAIDAAQHTFTIEPDLTAADVAQLDSRGFGAGARQIWLANQAPAMARAPAWLGDSATVPMLPGSERHGCLLETIEGRKQLTSWFTLHHGERNVVIEPRGHWATLRLQRQVARVHVFVVGWPDMEPVEGAGMAGPGEQRLFVADGTVAIRVDLGAGAPISFAPELTEMVVR